MPKKKRKRYTAEFKVEAVRLLETDPRPGADIARDLGIDRGMLYRWQRQLGRRATTVSSVEQVLSADEREELRRLRKRVAQLEMDREILKKATAFFAKESK
jgi:transposase